MEEKNLLLVSKGITNVDTRRWVKRGLYHWKQFDECCNHAKVLHEKGNIETRVYRCSPSGSFDRCLGIYSDKDNSTLDINNSSSILVLAKKFLTDLGCVSLGDYGAPMVGLKQVLIRDNNGDVGVVLRERFSLNTLGLPNVLLAKHDNLLSVGIDMDTNPFVLLIQSFINNILDYTCRLDAINITVKPQVFPRIYYNFPKEDIPTLEIGIEESDFIRS